MLNDPAPSKRGILKAAFSKAVMPAFERLQYLTTNYPSKMAAGTGLLGDGMFMFQSLSSGNNLGVYAALIGAYASYHLLRYGDPKITGAEKQNYLDPQDKRTIANWVNNPTQYPWEYMALIRMMSMGGMFVGSTGIGNFNPAATQSYGELAYSSFALAGYLVKMGIAEMPKGSVAVPEDAKGFLKGIYRMKAYVQENPNPTAGYIWNAGLVPYALEGLLKGEPFKIASAALYALPNTFTMFSSKRAQVLPETSKPL